MKLRGGSLESLDPNSGVDLMLGFYKQVRAEGCPLDRDGDMLLFQWGTYGRDQARHFQFKLIRQFLESGDGEDEDDGDHEISQLRLTFYYPPTEAFAALKRGNRWCPNPSEIGEFAAHIRSSPAYHAVTSSRSEKVALEYGAV